MTAVLHAADPDLDRDDLSRLLDLSARIVRGAPTDWRTLAEAFRPTASDDQRVEGILLLAGPLTDVVDTDDEEVLLRTFLPRLPIAERVKVLADCREELDRAQRFADACDAGDVEQLIDQLVANWVTVAEIEAGKHRDSARWVARQAVTA